VVKSGCGESEKIGEARGAKQSSASFQLAPRITAYRKHGARTPWDARLQRYSKHCWQAQAGSSRYFGRLRRRHFLQPHPHSQPGGYEDAEEKAQRLALDTASSFFEYRVMRRFFRIVFLLIVLPLLVGGWYLYRKGFTKSWREYVIAELRTHGVEASFSKLIVDPFKGLVARDVKFYQSAARDQVVAKVDEIIVEANFANALQGKTFLDALTLTDASLVLLPDVKKPNSPSLKIKKLNTRILLPPNQLLVSKFEAEIFGIHVNATGHMANLQMWKSYLPAEKPKEDGVGNIVSRICKELDRVKYPEEPTRLNLQFTGDLANPDALMVQCQINGGRIQWDDYKLNSLDAMIKWQNGALIVPRLEATDEKGLLQMSGNFVLATSELAFGMRSSLDLAGLIQAMRLSPLQQELKLGSPPEIELAARVTFGVKPHFQLTGHANLDQFTLGKSAFEKMAADFSWDGNQWAVRNLILKQKKGELRAEIQQVEGDFRLGIESTLNPEALVALLPKETYEHLKTLKFYDPPQISLSGRGTKLETMSASGTLQLGRTSFRGQEARKADINLRYNNRVLTVDHLHVVRAEGEAQGGLVFDMGRQEWYFNKMQINLHPVEAAAWVAADLIQDVKPYRFGRRPPQLLLEGVLDSRKGGLNTRLHVDVNAPGGMDYTFQGKELHFADVDGKLFFTDERVKLNGVNARLFGGTVRTDADISTQKTKPGHSASLRITNLDFSSLTKLYFDYNDSKGKLNAAFDFTGRGENGRTMEGRGEMTVTDGNVFAIPFLGPFSDILNKIVPGMGYNVAQKASAKFTVENGIILTKDFVVSGKGFSMIGDGRIWFLEDKMDFDIRINAQGLPGVLLFPMSKLFEYRADSKFSDPNWHPKVIPQGRQ